MLLLRLLGDGAPPAGAPTLARRTGRGVRLCWMHEQAMPPVVATDDVLSGAFRLAGTRIPVSLVLGCLAEGLTEKEMMAAFPSLPDGAVQSVLEFTAELLEHARPGLLSEALAAGRADEP